MSENSDKPNIESLFNLSPEEVRKRLGEFYFNFTKDLISKFNLELSVNNFNSNLYNDSLIFESKDVSVFLNRITNATHEFELIYSKKCLGNFGLRYILSFELPDEQNYNGINEEENNFNEKKINDFNNNSSLLEELTKMRYCEYSHKVFPNNVLETSFTYKSRSLICFDHANKDKAFDLIISLYDQHWKVLNNKS
jgi:hypothetical protein